MSIVIPQCQQFGRTRGSPLAGLGMTHRMPARDRPGAETAESNEVARCAEIQASLTEIPPA